MDSPLTDAERERLAELLKDSRGSGQVRLTEVTGESKNESYTPSSLKGELQAKLNVSLDKDEWHATEREHVSSLKADAALARFVSATSADAVAGLRLGVCLSGGGMRAFYETLGFMAGLEEIGALDCVEYTASLSGSSWMLWTFLVSKCATFQQFAMQAAIPLEKSIEFDRIRDDAWEKKAELGVVDVYAALLHALFLRRMLHIDENIVNISTATPVARKPFPITTFINLEHKKPLESVWFEATPYTVACAAPTKPTEGFTAIPTAAFGCRFERGQRVDEMSQDDVAFLMAVCGSAMAAPVRDLVQGAPSLVARALYCISWLRHAQDTDTLVNPAVADFRPSAEKNAMCLVRDAGMSLNLPLMPLLRRKCNVVLVMDASYENPPTQYDLPPRKGQELKRAQDWMTVWQKHFPDVMFPDIKKHASFTEDAPDLERKFHRISSTDQRFHLLYVPRLTDWGTLKIWYEPANIHATVKRGWDLIRAQAEQLRLELREIARLYSKAVQTQATSAKK